MSVSGSIRGFSFDGIPYNVAADANAALNPRIEVEPLPHSSGNMFKRTTMPANMEAIKLLLDQAEYDIIVSASEDLDDKSISLTRADGSSNKTQGTLMLGAYQTEDNSCEVIAMTSTGIWDNFSA